MTNSIDIDKLEQHLEPLAKGLLNFGQEPFAEKYLDLIGAIKEDPAYKHILLFWHYATHIDLEYFNKCNKHLSVLRSMPDTEYDIARCEHFYEWRRSTL